MGAQELLHLECSVSGRGRRPFQALKELIHRQWATMVVAGPAAEDPTLKQLRSGFGKQPKSEHETAAQGGFGSSHRDAFMKASESQHGCGSVEGCMHAYARDM